MTKDEKTIHWFNNAKGFGYLASHDRADLFIGFSAIRTGALDSPETDVPLCSEGTEGERLSGADKAVPKKKS